ncbi:MAG: potassium channel family protein [Deinococcales bacterium]
MKRKQFLVIGLGRFGSAVARTLCGLGHEVVAIDSREAPVDDITGAVTQAVIANATDETTLRELGITNFDAVIIAIGSDITANVYATLAARDAGATHIICKAVDDISKRILLKIGADKVIRPEHDSGVRLAQQLATPRMIGQIELGSDYSVMEIEASQLLVGRLEKVQQNGIQIIAHARGNTVQSSAPNNIELGDRLVLLGKKAALERLRDSSD